jgi:glutamate-1-semialdehyde 2,1-aminomutase
MRPATPIDSALRTRAARVVPGGMTGHLNAAYLPPGYPQFFARGDGCRLWDVDGREYIDFMCSWGPNLLGHHHPEVEAAAERRQLRAPAKPASLRRARHACPTRLNHGE